MKGNHIELRTEGHNCGWVSWRRILESSKMRYRAQLGAHPTLPRPPFRLISPKPRSIFHITTVWESLPHSSENFLANLRFQEEWEGAKTSGVDLQGGKRSQWKRTILWETWKSEDSQELQSERWGKAKKTNAVPFTQPPSGHTGIR